MSKRNMFFGVVITLLILYSSLLAFKVENLPRIKLPSGRDKNQVSNVKAIYVGPGGEIYIGSARNNSVKVFSGNGQYLRSIPSIEKDDIEVPQDIDIGIDGYVYVVDRERGELSRFGADGIRQGTLGGKKAFNKPMSVSVGRDGKVFVADKDAKDVKIFDENGQTLGNLQGSGFEEPIAVDVDHQGRAFVLDRKKKTVQIFDREGTLLKELSVQFGGTTIEEPVDLCVNQNGEIFVLDEKDKVVYFTADYESGQWSPPFGGGMFESPISIDVAGRDVCYVLDNKNETVWKFHLTELPSLVQETTVKESIIQKAVISNNIDSVANIAVNRILPQDKQLVLTVFENNRNIVSGLIAENFPEVAIKGQKVDVQKAEPLLQNTNIDFIILMGTVGLKAKDVQEIKTKLVTEFFSKLDESKHRVAVFTYSPEIKLALPLENSFSKQKTTVNTLEFNGEKAPLYDAIFEAMNYYDTVATRNYPIFVVITNDQGKTSRNNYRTLEEYKTSHGLPQIYTLGYDEKKTPDFLEEIKKIADISGGFFYSSDQRDMIYFLFRRAVALLRGEYILQVSDLPSEGELSVSVDVDMDGNLITASKEYLEPSGEKVVIKGETFLEKYGLILLIVILGLIILIIIIVAIAKAGSKPRAPMGEAILEVKAGSAPQKSYNLMKGANKIGKDKDSDICLPVEGVSRQHAVIEYAGGKYEIVDQGSTNGTFVNKNRIARRVLINNDVITIGSIDFIFKSG